MSIVFDKVDHAEFEAEEKTGNGSSFVSHFAKNRRKRPKIAGNRSAFREFESPSNSGGLGDTPARRFDSDYAECEETGRRRGWADGVTDG